MCGAVRYCRRSCSRARTGHARAMRGIDVFCERCGARQPQARREPAAGAGLARRLVSAVNRTADGVPQPAPEMFLRLCLECRGYSCPACWNEAAGACQSCAPLPEPVLPPLPEVQAVPEVLAAPEVQAEPEVLAVPAVQPVPDVQATPEPVAEPTPPPPLVPPLVAPPPVVAPPVVMPLAAQPVARPAPAPASPEAPRPVPPPASIPTPAPAPMPLPLAAAPALPASQPRPAGGLSEAPPVVPRPRPSITFETPLVPPTPVSAQAYASRAYLPVPERPASGPAAAGVRPCRNCALPLSAKAHFCRRCGSAQELS